METTKQNTKQFTEENDLLNQQNMGEQSQDFMELFKYAAGMQLQLAVMADELQGVKEQLSQLQENQPKSVKENLMDKVAHLQEKITNLSERLSAVKDRLMETAVGESDAVAEFGDKAVTVTFGNAKKQISYEILMPCTRGTTINETWHGMMN